MNAISQAEPCPVVTSLKSVLNTAGSYYGYGNEDKKKEISGTSGPECLGYVFLQT